VLHRANQFRRYARSLTLSGGVTTRVDDECGARREHDVQRGGITGAAGSQDGAGTLNLNLTNTYTGRDGDFQRARWRWSGDRNFGSIVANAST